MISTEFPPAIGGMQVMAFNLAQGLSRRHDLVVYTRGNQGYPAPGLSTEPVLAADIGHDLRPLAAADADVDVWLAMNAGYGALAGRLRKPMAVVCNGNDFLTPWVIDYPRQIDLLEGKPHVWRYAHPLRQAWRRRVLREGLSRAAAVLPISEHSRNLVVRRFGLGIERTVIVHPGVEDKFFQTRTPAAGGTLRLLTVSRLDTHNRRKNVDGVLRAVGMLRRETDIRYTVVGDGNDRLRLEALAGELGIGDVVDFTGRADEARLLAAYRDADLFVLAGNASETDVEGFGIVYIEAIAGGVPVLCSRSGGAVDAVRDGETGILIGESDPRSIAEGIRRFQAARSRFEPARISAYAERFRWGAAIDRVETVLMSLARGGAARDAGLSAGMPAGDARRAESVGMT
ncbi:glycosyltransferase family 4 protein (plasmid) [Skermanella mucosa]|uniref:glycosyltransferase family 4 protein n=1 Tax=Skermanella mucosa TaxID=1789672 RepID=UPI00192C2555|nr:glycosyltransferase family 4 protein [Skermanella mucosa]UEM24601.1 glycosyltransferase family 4 protein [Skermanella mucosa]